MIYPVGGHWSVSVVTPPNDDDVLTIDQLKERARIVDGDVESDELVKSYISAACRQFERDTGYALSKQTIAIGYDRVDAGGVYVVPRPPLNDVTSIVYMGVDGAAAVLDPNVVIAQIDRVSAPGRLTFTSGAFAGLPAPLGMQPLGLVVDAGYAPDAIPADFRQAVGLLAAHYLTTGRDRVVMGQNAVSIMPSGYDEIVNAWRLEVVA